MSSLQEVGAWRGRRAVDADGDKIGSIEDVYLDRQSGEPEWIAVKTGLFGTKVSFVPIRDARLDGDEVRVGHAKDKVKDAPSVEPDGELSPDEERALYEHYGRSDYGDWNDDAEDRTTGLVGRDRDDDSRFGDDDTRVVGTEGHRGHVDDDDARFEHTTGTGDADYDDDSLRRGDGMTRSEEELHVGTEARETGRARLRKWVETEEESRTVEVAREEARIEREPITDANRDAALSGAEITESEHEVTLYEEEPVIEKRVEPKERIRLGKDVQTDEHTVSEDVRKERIEADGDVADR